MSCVLLIAMVTFALLLHLAEGEERRSCGHAMCSPGLDAGCVVVCALSAAAAAGGGYWAHLPGFLYGCAVFAWIWWDKRGGGGIRKLLRRIAAKVKASGSRLVVALPAAAGAAHHAPAVKASPV